MYDLCESPSILMGGGREGGLPKPKTNDDLPHQPTEPLMPLRGGPDAIHRARALRHDMTIPERQLWPGLRRGLLGARFRRQHPHHLPHNAPTCA